MVRDFVDRSRFPQPRHPGERAGTPSDFPTTEPSSSATVSNALSSDASTEMAPDIGPLKADRNAFLGPALTAVAMAVALAGCWPYQSSTSSPPSSRIEDSKPVSGPQTAEGNDMQAEQFPSLDTKRRIDDAEAALRSDAAKREEELDLLRAVRPDQMPPVETSPNGLPPGTTEERSTTTIRPELKESPAVPPAKQAARPSDPAGDEVWPITKHLKDPPKKSLTGEDRRRPNVEEAQRPKVDESRPPNADESPLPKAKERQRPRIAHRGQREHREDERPTKLATKQASLRHGFRSVRNARASTEKISIPPVGQLVLPAALRPTRPPI